MCPLGTLSWNWMSPGNYLIEKNCSGGIMHAVLGIYNYDVFRTMEWLPHVTRLSKIPFVRILWGRRGWEDEFEDGVLNYARTIVAALWDFEVLHSCLLAVPDALEIRVDHGLALNGDMSAMTLTMPASPDKQGLVQCQWQCFWELPSSRLLAHPPCPPQNWPK